MSGPDTSKRRRRSPTKDEKLAAACLEIQRLRRDPIDREAAKMMTADQIASLFQFDHDAGYAAHGADNHPTKITPMLIAGHREKTAAMDIPAIAKCRRISAEHQEFQRKLLAKVGQLADAEAARRKKHSIPSRPLPCGRKSGWKKPLGSFIAVRRGK